MASETILVERRGAVAIVRFNRPDKLNAMNSKMKDEIIAALREIDSDDSLRVAVLTGQGEKAFVAGGGINEFKDRTARGPWDLNRQPALYDLADRFPKP